VHVRPLHSPYSPTAASALHLRKHQTSWNLMNFIIQYPHCQVKSENLVIPGV